MVNDLNKCSSCFACKLSCKFSAISVLKHDDGFLYPNKNDKCILCNKCESICPANKKLDLNSVKETYAVANNNVNELLKSSSGGFFFLVAKNIILNGGVVFGAYLEGTKVYHRKCDTLEDLIHLQGSKYVESDLKETYVETKQLLENNRLVLFSGTPCQIDGLHSFLCKDYDCLYTIDLICHGVPSRELYDSFIKFYSEKYHSNVVNISFRDKSINGWNLIGSLTFSNGKKIVITPYNCAYYHYFDIGSIYKKSCYSCKYANYDYRVSDVTIGDFWGVENNKNIKFKVENGVSLVLINTVKGKRIFNQIENDINTYKITKDEATKQNYQLICPVSLEKRDESLLVNSHIKGYSFLQKSFKRSFKSRFKNMMLIKIPSRIKYKIKGKCND